MRAEEEDDEQRRGQKRREEEGRGGGMRAAHETRMHNFSHRQSHIIVHPHKKACTMDRREM